MHSQPRSCSQTFIFSPLTWPYSLDTLPCILPAFFQAGTNSLPVFLFQTLVVEQKKGQIPHSGLCNPALSRLTQAPWTPERGSHFMSCFCPGRSSLYIIFFKPSFQLSDHTSSTFLGVETFTSSLLSREASGWTSSTFFPLSYNSGRSPTSLFFFIFLSTSTYLGIYTLLHPFLSASTWPYSLRSSSHLFLIPWGSYHSEIYIGEKETGSEEHIHLLKLTS